jgi:hypothetical protein
MLRRVGLLGIVLNITLVCVFVSVNLTSAYAYDGCGRRDFKQPFAEIPPDISDEVFYQFRDYPAALAYGGTYGSQQERYVDFYIRTRNKVKCYTLPEVIVQQRVDYVSNFLFSGARLNIQDEREMRLEINALRAWRDNRDRIAVKVPFMVTHYYAIDFSQIAIDLRENAENIITWYR